MTQVSRSKLVTQALPQPTRNGFHGSETELRAVPGLRMVRVAHPPDQRIEAHGHDWACLTVFRCGSYSEQVAAEEMIIDAPGVVFHPGGQQHANRIGARGLETTSFLFDPSLLRQTVPAKSLRDGRIWRGGVIARAAERLLREAVGPAVDPAVAISRFLGSALMVEPVRIPPWLSIVRRAISYETVGTVQLAHRLDLHPAWLARAYRHAVGESIPATIRRHKVERALILVRSTRLTLAQIAAEAGFCDQSHMVRCFHAVIGRVPCQVRAESDRAA